MTIEKCEERVRTKEEDKGKKLRREKDLDMEGNRFEFSLPSKFFTNSSVSLTIGSVDLYFWSN